MPLSAPSTAAPPVPAWADDFTTNQLAGYTTAGVALTVGSGELRVNTADGTSRAYRTTTSALKAGIVSHKINVGTTAAAASTQAGCLLRFVGSDDYIRTSYNFNTRVHKIIFSIANVETDAATSSVLEAAPAAGSARWTRAGVVGNYVFAAIYDQAPGPGVAPLAGSFLAATASLSVAESATAVGFGWHLTFPDTTTWSLDYHRVWRVGDVLMNI